MLALLSPFLTFNAFDGRLLVADARNIDDDADDVDDDDDDDERCMSRTISSSETSIIL